MNFHAKHFMQGTEVPDIDRLRAEEQRIVAKRRLDLELYEQEERVKRMRLENSRMNLENSRMNMDNFERLCKIMPEEDMDERDRIVMQDLRRRSLHAQTQGSTLLLEDSGSGSSGQEISIPQVAQKYKFKYHFNHAGSIGKVIRKLYIARYHEEPHKRGVTHGGKPIDENAYWEKDEDIVKAAIIKYASNATPEQIQEANALIAELLG